MRRHGPVIAHCTDSEDFPSALHSYNVCSQRNIRSAVNGRWVGAASGSLVNGRWIGSRYGRWQWHGRWVGGTFSDSSDRPAVPTVNSDQQNLTFYTFDQLESCAHCAQYT